MLKPQLLRMGLPELAAALYERIGMPGDAFWLSTCHQHPRPDGPQDQAHLLCYFAKGYQVFQLRYLTAIIERSSPAATRIAIGSFAVEGHFPHATEAYRLTSHKLATAVLPLPARQRTSKPAPGISSSRRRSRPG